MIGGVLQTWGQNQNYTCGAESEAARRYPDKINLPLDDPVIHTSFSKYHGLCLTDSGKVFSWGLNQKGRLGYEGPSVELQPKRINFGTDNLCQRMLEVNYISCAINHSIYIGKCGRAFISGRVSNIASSSCKSQPSFCINTDYTLWRGTPIRIPLELLFIC